MIAELTAAERLDDVHALGDVDVIVLGDHGVG